MTSDQRELYGAAFDRFSAAFNRMQAGGLAADAAAVKVVDAAEQIPAPIRVPVGPDAEEILQMVRQRSDAELDVERMRLVDLDPSPTGGR